MALPTVRRRRDGLCRRVRRIVPSELWRQRIYRIRVDPSLERDVQDVFITSLTVRGGSLVIANEHGDRYALDLSTRKVTRESDRHTQPCDGANGGPRYVPLLR